MIHVSPLSYSDLKQIRTVKVSNVSLSATKKHISDFFSFSGDIQFIEFRRFVFFAYLVLYILNVFLRHWCYFCRETEITTLVYVTFKEAQGADTAILMSVCYIYLLYTSHQVEFLFEVIYNVQLHSILDNKRIRCKI